ncbi:MAG: hypothetical protein ISR77_33810 [Pirellulaceae bacterium]|nr:hypothetical protein [Pirellulaceae bacterium]
MIDGKREPVQIPACDVEVIAPISLRIDSLERLSKGIGSLESLLNVDRRTLSGHEACFRELLENGDGRYLTIELEEIACIVDPEVFYSHLAELLRFFDGSNSETARDAWRSLAELDLTRPIISPKDFDERPDLTTEDYRNLENLLGSSYIRPTTWPE